MSNTLWMDEPALESRAAEPARHWRQDLQDIVAALRLSREVTHNIRHKRRLRPLPSREALDRVLDLLASALFPSHFGRADLNAESIDYFVGHTLAEALGMLTEQVRRSLFISHDEDDFAESALDAKAAEIVRALAVQLPAIRDLLVSDLHAAFAGDPAAKSFPEILLGYPGMTAILCHRIARALYRLDMNLVARLIAQIAHSKTGIDIHPGAEIGRGFFIDHGTGVVIGETAVIGERVRLYQAVTLGAKSFQEDESGMLIKGNKRHPIVEDDVVIYAGATVLGRITIGRGSVIGGNVWLTQSVAPGSVITQAAMRGC